MKNKLAIIVIVAIIGVSFAALSLTGCDNGGDTTDIPVTPGGTTTYAITMQNDGNGTATASPNPAAQGAEVTITATHNSGYRFVNWQVISGGITLTHSTANPTVFTMPGNAVTIKANFEALPPNTPLIKITPPKFNNDEAQTPKNVTIKNEGTGTANITSIALDATGDTAFTLSGTSSITTLAVNETKTFTIQPKTGLAVGTYEGNITVTYDSGMTAQAGVSFTVTVATIEGNTRETAIQLTANTWANGNLTNVNGEQWYKFTATASTHYIHANVGTLTALFVQVYNPSNEPPVSRQDVYEGGVYVNSYTGSISIPLNVTAGQEYYIKVRREYSNYTGTYQIGFTSNNFLPLATSLTANVWANGNLPYENSEQWYKFTATASTQYIHVNFGTLNYLSVQLYDSSGVAVGSQTNLYSSTKNTTRTVTVGQEYYIKVSPYNINSGTYQIAFNAMSILTPNVTTLTANVWANGNIPTADDEQWFKFNATASTQYIHVNFGTLEYLYVQVYDSNGTAVGSNTNLYDNTKNTTRTLTVGQEYYIKVQPSGSKSGTYQIGFNATWYPPGVIQITEKVWAGGNLPTSNNVQWFKFTATASKQYIYLGFETLDEMIIRLYTSSGVAVGSSDSFEASDMFGNTNFSEITGLTVGQEYYINVSPRGGSSGTYKISFGTIGISTDYFYTYPFITPPDTFTTLTLDVWNVYPSSTVTWFKFTAIATLHYIGIDSGSANVNIAVYDSNGFPLKDTVQLYGPSAYYRNNTYSGFTVGKEYYIWARGLSGSGGQLKFSTTNPF